MEQHSLDFLKTLLGTPAPSGDETAAARVWRAEAKTFADDVYADVRNSSYAVLRGDPTVPRVLLAGHIDEIGLMISYIDSDGFLFFSAIGGWDSQVFVGQRIRLLGKLGDVIGVIGKKAIHHIKGSERDNASKIEDLWIDIGVKNKDEALQQVRIGTVGVIDAPMYAFTNNRIVSRSLDNRIGAFTVLEALRLLSQDRPRATVAAVATSQEEITFAGAMTAAFHFEPQVAIAVDVTHASDHPGGSKKISGDISLGGGPTISRGSANSPILFEKLLATADAEKIPYVIEASPRYTGTDADAIHTARSGVATAVISIPNRYMHSPNEMIQMDDVENAAKLVAALVHSLGPESSFIPE